jgi:hypothetical protein
MKSNLKWILALLVLTLLFYWKIVFTGQFSILTSEEAVNQGYCWYNFAASTVQHGRLPLWDPFVAAGRTFVGGMETGLFYPVKWLLYAFPMGPSGQLSPRLYQDFIVLAHFLAACFMFLLIKDLGLSSFSGLAAGITFGMGGLIARAPWPDMIDSAVWLPLVILFLRRALRSVEPGRKIRYGALCGMALGMAVLAGRIHIVMMDVIVVVSAALYFTWNAGDGEKRGTPALDRWISTAKIVGIIGVLAFCIGAIQLLPSVELSRRAVRYIGTAAPAAASERIPYLDLKEDLWPRGLFTAIFFAAFPGSTYGGEGFGIYIGVMPLILMMVGVWRNWHNPWVRYLAGLAVAAFTLTLGSYSLVHGLAYILVPYLWIARGASRFIYISQFAMAILAGFGSDTLFVRKEESQHFTTLIRIMKWAVAVMALPMLSAAMTGKPELNEWVSLSFIIIAASSALFYYIVRGHASRSTQFLVIFVIMFDLSAFCWLIQNRAREDMGGRDQLQNLMNCKDLAGFLNSRKELFRVNIESDYSPNLGDMFGVQIIQSRMATELTDLRKFRESAPRSLDQMNVRYTVSAKPLVGRTPVYTDRLWLVYENPDYLPRAWLVHKTAVVLRPEFAIPRMREPDFDPRRMAVLDSPLPAELQDSLDGKREEAQVVNFEVDRLEVKVNAASRALLVLSEVDYPGWKAEVNGQPVPIHKVNGLLRGIVVPAGESRISLRYIPDSIIQGAILSLAGFAFSISLVVLTRRRPKPRGALRA